MRLALCASPKPKNADSRPPREVSVIGRVISERAQVSSQQPSPTTRKVVSVDLVSASYRSSSFPQDWSREQRELQAKRYEMFLQLAAKHPGKRCTPTREIDEFWHLHMLHPVAYHQDCMKLFGRIFDHDGGFGTAPGELPVLKHAFQEFALRWQEEYGEPYVRVRLGEDASATKCWHDCSNRCWHACSD